ncbi:MAG: class I SAM-dependent methyltransferase, partial [Planctomycetota bacterium]
SPIKDQAAYEAKLAMTREFLRPDARVLEIGCGTGSTAISHAPYAAHILATDVSEEMIEIARDKAATAGLENVDFATVSAEALSLPERSLDMVMAHSILHLVDDYETVLAQAHRWLKPGGLLVTSTPCLSDMVPWLRFVAPVARLVRLFPPTLRFFSEERLRASLQSQGFTIERRYRPGPKAAVFIIARKAG